MNRLLTLGIATFVVIVGIALMGGQSEVQAGHGCRGCNGCKSSCKARCGGCRKAHCGGCRKSRCCGRQRCSGCRRSRCNGCRRSRCCGPTPSCTGGCGGTATPKGPAPKGGDTKPAPK